MSDSIKGFRQIQKNTSYLNWRIGVKRFVNFVCYWERLMHTWITGPKDSKDSKRELKIFFSKILLQIGKSDTGRELFIICLSPFLCTGITFVFLHSFGKHSFITLLLKRICRGFEIDVTHNFNMRNDIPSQSWASFESNERINLIIVSVSILISESLVIVSMV